MDVQQQIVNGMYDTSTEQQMKFNNAMNHMWNMDQYNTHPYAQPHPAMMKDEKYDPSMLKHDSSMILPFFGQQFQSPFPDSTTLPIPSQSGRSTPGPTKKKPQPVPDSQKDENYRERRRRNNDAARKSREQRKRQEGLNTERLDIAMKENVYLRHEVQRLYNELQRANLIAATFAGQLKAAQEAGVVQVPTTY